MARADPVPAPIGWLRQLFFALVVRPLVLVVLGLAVWHRERLPGNGPAIVVANHNSHLDTLVLMTLFGWRRLRLLRPVAAADYFLANRVLAWFSTRVIGILPLDREAHGRPLEERLAGVVAALEAGAVVIVFPEGSRGEPERLARFRRGVAVLSALCPAAAVVPVWLHGLGKALPRGEGILVPFFCDVVVGEPLAAAGDDAEAFVAGLERRLRALAAELHRPAWE